jgi:hypothetical protein
MGITDNTSTHYIAMYSHNRPERRYMYRGPLLLADRYGHSLLSRLEDNNSKAAYRCIMFYIGDNSLEYCVSGLMLRGVSGQNFGGTQAVCVPFVAIHVSNDDILDSPQFTEIRRRTLYSLHPNASVLIGHVRNERGGPLFTLCDSIFSHLKRIKNGLFYQNNSIILRTVAPDELIQIDELEPEIWSAAISSLLAEKS